jgi:mono/diheme cytochrome c family protein
MTRMFAVAVLTALVLMPGTAYTQDKMAEKGMQVFTVQKCNVCHSIAGKGKKNGPLDDVGSRLSAAEIRQWINDPIGMAAKREPKSTRKPPMKKKVLPADDVEALVVLLSGLKK